MSMYKTNFENVRKAFNSINVAKGQHANIATSDGNGNPNVAPIGSMRVVDSKTVHVLKGFLPRTMANLRNNPKATFSVCLPPSIWDLVNLFKDDDEKVLGYQVHCTFRGESTLKTDINREVDAIATRVPFWANRPFRRFCNKKLTCLLTFTIDDVRTIGAPEQPLDS